MDIVGVQADRPVSHFVIPVTVEKAVKTKMTNFEDLFVQKLGKQSSKHIKQKIINYIGSLKRTNENPKDFHQHLN